MTEIIELEFESISELNYVANQLLDFVGDSKVFLFYAAMGAGKTTLIKELCTVLGSKDNFSSPTYSIVNEYKYPGGKIFHFDLYRLQNTEELMDIGIEEYLDSNQFCLFEWPELIESITDKNHIKIEIEVKENIRYLRATKF